VGRLKRRAAGSGRAPARPAGRRAGRPVRPAGGARPAHAAPPARPIGCVIVTVSDTRGAHDDASGDAIAAALARAGHRVIARSRVRDEVAAIRRAMRSALARTATDVLILTGGTGVAARDVTPEAVAPLLDKVLPGFGERFRTLSWSEVGAAAWLSRALAGIAGGRLVIVLPGSTRAVELAMRTLVLPELGHVVRLLGRLERGE
jgi:molybdenum cofactor biosynthesis protein B